MTLKDDSRTDTILLSAVDVNYSNVAFSSENVEVLEAELESNQFVEALEEVLEPEMVVKESKKKRKLVSTELCSFNTLEEAKKYRVDNGFGSGSCNGSSNAEKRIRTYPCKVHKHCNYKGRIERKEDDSGYTFNGYGTHAVGETTAWMTKCIINDNIVHGGKTQLLQNRLMSLGICKTNAQLQSRKSYWSNAKDSIGTNATFKEYIMKKGIGTKAAFDKLEGSTWFSVHQILSKSYPLASVREFTEACAGFTFTSKDALERLRDQLIVSRNEVGHAVAIGCDGTFKLVGEGWVLLTLNMPIVHVCTTRKNALR